MARVGAVRVSQLGTVIDASPISVSPGEAARTTPRSLSDGTNSLVAWNDERLTPNFHNTWAARINQAGVVLDPSPILLSSVIVPDAPSSVSGTAGNSEVALTWTAPASDGGAAITDYEVTVYDGEGGAATGVTGATTRLVGSATTSYTFTGLTNGTVYTFKVAALNAAGAGSQSGLSAAVTPRTVPGAPTAVAGTAGNGEVALTWVAPASDGGAAVTDYEVSVYDGAGGAATGVTGATTRLVGSAATSYTFTGLSNGTAYTFKVAALNVAGSGLQSALSSAATPRTVPAAPTGVKSASGATTVATGSLVVSFTAGANNGSAITSYTATCTRQRRSDQDRRSVRPSPLTVTAVTTGKTYTCTVTATNAVGTGPGVGRVAAGDVGSPAPPTASKAVSGRRRRRRVR